MMSHATDIANKIVHPFIKEKNNTPRIRKSKTKPKKNNFFITPLPYFSYRMGFRNI